MHGRTFYVEMAYYVCSGPNVHGGVFFLAADIFDECSGIEMNDNLKICTSIVIAQKFHQYDLELMKFAATFSVSLHEMHVAEMVLVQHLEWNLDKRTLFTAFQELKASHGVELEFPRVECANIVLHNQRGTYDQTDKIKELLMDDDVYDRANSKRRQRPLRSPPPTKRAKV